MTQTCTTNDLHTDLAYHVLCLDKENKTLHEHTNLDNITSTIDFIVEFQSKLYKVGCHPTVTKLNFVVADAYPDSANCVYCDKTGKE